MYICNSRTGKFQFYDFWTSTKARGGGSKTRPLGIYPRTWVRPVLENDINFVHDHLFFSKIIIIYVFIILELG